MAEAARRHRWTAEDVARMVEAGVLREDDPLELLDGELIVVSPQGPRHRMSAVRVHRRLERAFGPGFYVQDHSPVLAAPDSLPEPDVAVVREPERFDRHPSAEDTPLVVEISSTSQREDRQKAEIYAAGGFPEYWILDLEARRLTVYRQPRPEARAYAVVTLYLEPDEVPVGSGRIPVAELLPPS